MFKHLHTTQYVSKLVHSTPVLPLPLHLGSSPPIVYYNSHVGCAWMPCTENHYDRFRSRINIFSEYCLSTRHLQAEIISLCLVDDACRGRDEEVVNDIDFRK